MAAPTDSYQHSLLNSLCVDPTSSMGSRRVCTGLLMLVATLATVSMVAAVTVIIENESITVGQMLDVHCHNNGGKDFGVQRLSPFTHISWKFTTGFFGRDTMTCTFTSAGKPTTTIDVFKGYAFNRIPCNCNGGGTCFWQALNEGFWCNHNFIQKWG